MSSLGDARFTLAAAAAQSERRARPRALPLAAALAFVVCAIWLSSQLAALGAAKSSLQRAERDANTVERLGSEIERLRAAAAANPDTQAFAPVRASALAALAEQAGLGENIIPTDRTSEVGGMTQRLITFNFESKPLDQLMTFMQSITDRYPGTHVYSVELSIGRGANLRRANTPDPTGWNLDVTFARLERNE